MASPAAPPDFLRLGPAPSIRRADQTGRPALRSICVRCRAACPAFGRSGGRTAQLLGRVLELALDFRELFFLAHHPRALEASAGPAVVVDEQEQARDCHERPGDVARRWEGE